LHRLYPAEQFLLVGQAVQVEFDLRIGGVQFVRALFQVGPEVGGGKLVSPFPA
jgi:hypothetical protein